MRKKKQQPALKDTPLILRGTNEKRAAEVEKNA